MRKMDKDELLERITEEDIIELLMEFGSSAPLRDHQQNLLFDTCVCHGGDSLHKLCYFKETKSFYCYTGGHAPSLFDIIMFQRQCSFKESFDWLKERKGIHTTSSLQRGFKENRFINEDLTFLDCHLTTHQSSVIELSAYPIQVLNLFHGCYPMSWKEEGVSPEVAQRFDLRFCFKRQATIIPCFDPKGRLIGIRQRNHSLEDIEAGRKYIPTTIEQTTYRYPTSAYLYGLYEHQHSIQTRKEAILFEAEKSVLIHSSYYAQSTAVAMGGTNLSLIHRQLLLDHGVERVTICLDKQYQIDRYQVKNSPERREYERHIRKLKKIVSTLVNYVSVRLVMCYDDRLAYKDSPIDRGKKVYESLLNESMVVYQADDLDELLD